MATLKDLNEILDLGLAALSAFSDRVVCDIPEQEPFIDGLYKDARNAGRKANKLAAINAIAFAIEDYAVREIELDPRNEYPEYTVNLIQRFLDQCSSL